MKKILFILALIFAFYPQITLAQNDNLNCTGDVCNFNYDPNGNGGGTTTGGAGANDTTTGSGTNTGANSYGPGGVSTGAGVNSCDYVSTQSDYNRCCLNNPNPSYSCAVYNIQVAHIQYCKDHPTDTSCAGVPGQTTSGTQNTNAINAGTQSNSGGTVGAPKSGAADLTQCSAIKFKSVLDILIWVKCIITSAIIPLIFVFAFLFFLWSVLKFMMANEKSKKDDAKKMIYAAIIGLFIMVAVWGIIKILSTTLGIESTGIPFLQTTYLDPNKQ